MKATIKNLMNSPVEMRGVNGPIIAEPRSEITDDFDPLWLQSAKAVRYFEVVDKRGPGRPPKDPLDHDGDGKKGGFAKEGD